MFQYIVVLAAMYTCYFLFVCLFVYVVTCTYDIGAYIICSMHVFMYWVNVTILGWG